MANPRVLKAVSTALAAFAELDPKEQQAALSALQAALKGDREPIRDTTKWDPDGL